MFRRLTIAAAVFTTLPAFGGSVIEQTVRTKLNENSANSKYVWNIDGQQFHLKITGDGRETIYIFNGKNFYVCSKLDGKQIDLLEKNKLKRPDIVKKLKEGACQAAPSNFMARFFLAPMSAVESIDLSDGMRLTLSVDDYSFKTFKASGKVGEQGCVERARAFTMAKTGDDGKMATKVDETYCESELPWREGLWKEVAKAVMRQPGGMTLVKKLKQDFADSPGLPLKNSSKFSITDDKGKVHKGEVELKTNSFKAVKLDSRTFKTPEGYSVFSPESLELAGDGGPAGKGAEKKDGEVGDFIQSLVFCAIAGALGCFN